MLLPGDTIRMNVTFDGSNRTGSSTSSILILTDDSLQPKISVILRAVVVRDVTVQPAFFSVDNRAPVGETYRTIVRLRNINSITVNVQVPVRDIGDDSVRIHLQVPPTFGIPPGGEKEVVAEVTPLLPGLVSRKFIFITDSRYQHELTVPLYSLGTSQQ
jgi:hypothetical protein